MKNMKGFTLVELLAVIVILAIVALVTAPAILNVINDSRLGGAEDKAWGTIEAVKLAYTQSQTDGNGGANDPVVTFTATGDNAAENSSIGRAISMSGDRPVAGSVKINTSNGEITAVGLQFNSNGVYTCTTNTDGTDMCCAKGTNAPTLSDGKCGKKNFKGNLAQ